MQRKVWLSLRTPITMLLLLAFVLIVGNWAYKETVTPIPKRPPEPCVVASIGPEFTAKNVTIRILNGTSRSGLAKNTKLIFGGEGFYVLVAGNAEQPTAKTFIAGASADNAEVVLVRSYFPADTTFTADPVKYRDHTVDIVLGDDFKPENLSKEPIRSIPLPDGKACVPHYKAISSNE